MRHETLLIAVGMGWLALLTVLGISILMATMVLFYYGSLWLQAYMSGADVKFSSLVGMTFRQVPARTIVTAQIMARQSGLSIEQKHGISTRRLEAHYLSGGQVTKIIIAIIAARRAGIELDFDRACAMDLAGRDVLEAVRTSVSPRVIDCPEAGGAKRTLSAVAKNGVELRVRARVTVRTNMDNLIGGATEKTIIARVGQGIVTTIGSAESHMDVLQMPDRISKGLLKSGLDANTAFEIVSIDIADIDIGENVGARLQTDQASADMRVSLAASEARRAGAVAYQTEMKAKILENKALLMIAEAEIPRAISKVFAQSRNQFATVIKIPIGSMADGLIV